MKFSLLVVLTLVLCTSSTVLTSLESCKDALNLDAKLDYFMQQRKMKAIDKNDLPCVPEIFDPSAIPSFSPSESPSEEPSLTPTSMPTEVPLFISLGAFHTCAIDDTRGLWCWGRNEFGQLGTNDTHEKLSPTRVQGLTNGILDVELGGRHSCAIDTLKKLFCWGWNGAGQLGIKNIVDQYVSVPKQVSFEPLASSRVHLVRLGWWHSCAIHESEDVFCWGKNGSGQLGIGNTEDKELPDKIVFNNQTMISQLEVGGWHNCLVVEISDQLYCWGRNFSGQLGLGDFKDRSTPALVETFNHGVSVLALGDGHTCVVDSNEKLFCWGHNGIGELGLGDYSYRSTPTQVTSLPNGVTQIKIALGWAHSCAVDTNAELYCWGNNHVGQLGLGKDDTDPRNVPTKVESNMNGVSQISLGNLHSCAIDNDDCIWCWGWNLEGQLGVGDKESRETPTPILNFFGHTAEPSEVPSAMPSESQMPSESLVPSSQPSQIPTINCRDRKSRFTIDGETRRWCRWAGKKHSAYRCTSKNLYLDCPATCTGECFVPSSTPSLMPSKAPSLLIPVSLPGNETSYFYDADAKHCYELSLSSTTSYAIQDADGGAESECNAASFSSDYSCGSSSSISFGVNLFTNGSDCGQYGKRSSTVHILLSSDVTAPTIISVKEFSVCRYEFLVKVPPGFSVR